MFDKLDGFRTISVGLSSPEAELPTKTDGEAIGFFPIEIPIEIPWSYIKPYEIWLKSNKIVPKLGM